MQEAYRFESMGKDREKKHPRSHEKKRGGSVLCTYILCTVFVAVFARIYNLFGHGVESPYMNFAWIVPALGTLWVLLLVLLRRPFHEPARELFGAGIATITVGSLLQGIFEIAGTGSPYVLAFFVAGIVLAAAAVVLQILYGRSDASRR